MKFTLSWLKEHLRTDAGVRQVADAMTMAGLEVEHVADPAASLLPFSVARIVEAVQHPNADRLRVCQVDTVDGRKEIVCGAPNARAGLTTIYAPVGAYVPGLDVTLTLRPVRGVNSDGMLCSASELQLSSESDGILELDGSLPVGTPAAQVFGAEPVIDFEVTPNRPDWLGVAGVARDLAAAGLGELTTAAVTPVPGAFPCPVQVRVDGDACPVFAGRLIRGVRNGPSPEWLQARLRAIGLTPRSALVDVTNYIAFDRCRPLHAYDADLLVGGVVEARLGKGPAEPSGDAPSPTPHRDEQLIALDGKTYDIGAAMCVIADAGGERPIGLGGVMGGASTAVSEGTTSVFLESAWFDPIRTAQTGRDTGITSDAQYRFARGVDPGFVVDGLELATAMVLELCGGEASEVVTAGDLLPAPAPVVFDPARVSRLTGLSLSDERIADILEALGFAVARGEGATWTVTPPSWRRDVEGPADLVEEVARIEGLDALPSTPLPPLARPASGVLTPLQARTARGRRALAAMGYREAVTWSFTSREAARLFGGGDHAVVLDNPIAADLDTLRPSILPNLAQAAARNAARGFADVALFEAGPVFAGAEPRDQQPTLAALLAPHAPRDWQAAAGDPLFTLKGQLFGLLEALGAPVGSLQLVQDGLPAWWRPGRGAALKLGPKVTVASFGELHPRVLKALDAEGPMLGFEIALAALPEPRGKGGKSRPALSLSPLMPLTRDFAFLLDAGRPAGDLVRAVAGADKGLIDGVRVFDVYAGAGVPEGHRSLALEVSLQPRERSLTDADIEAVSAKVIAAAEKLGAKLRG